MDARTQRLFDHADDVPWWTHRIVISDEYDDGLTEVRYVWSTLDLYHAHKVLDVVTKAREQEREDTDPKP